MIQFPIDPILNQEYSFNQRSWIWDGVSWNLKPFQETDPIFNASQAKNITSTHITVLNNTSGTNTGDQDLSGLVEKKANHSLVPDLEIEKLAGIEENANNYTHPETHPSSIITQDANNRFVTDAEKTTWNAKASTDVATTSVAGLMSSSDKTKLDGIATGANNYEHPETHPASILDVVDVVNGATNKFMNERGEMVAVAHESLTDKNSEADFQHVTQEQISDWNAKQEPLSAFSNAISLTQAEYDALAIKDANTLYLII